MRSALIMARSEWERLRQHQDCPIEIDISETPIAAIAQDAQIVGSFIERTADGEGLITIFRDDPNDTPYNINVDKYEVWEHIPLRLDYEQTVKSASTSDDSSLRSFLDEYVFIVPAEKGPDHHLSEVPATYKAILKREKAAS
jgi:hypothetical protein